MSFFLYPFLFSTTALGYLVDPDSKNNLLDPDSGEPLSDPDAGFTIFPMVQSFYNRWMNTESLEQLDFDVPLTAENYADPEVNDKWDHFNDMYVGTTTPNGYVLGTLIGPASGRTFSLTGSGAAGLSVSSSGVITLTDNSTWNTEQVKSVNLVVSDLGTFPFTIQVRPNNSGAVYDQRTGFLDPDNGDDANSGWQPHLPKKTLASLQSSTGFALRTRVKRGTVLNESQIYIPGLSNGSTQAQFGAYGDPSLPPVKLNVTAAAAMVRAASGITNVVVSDFDIYGGTSTSRGISMLNTNSVTFKRVRVMSNPAGGANGQGFYFFGGTGNKVRWCATSGAVIGDSLYGTACNNFESKFNDWGPRNGAAGDHIEFTDENNLSQTNNNVIISDNICRHSEATDSGKGNIVMEGVNNCVVENNFCCGNLAFFNVTSMGRFMTVRNNYGYKANLAGQATFGVGQSADFISYNVKNHHNTFFDTSRGLYRGGFPKTNYTWYRGDGYDFGNTIINAYTLYRCSERNTGAVKYNLGINCVLQAPEIVGQGSVVANNTKTGTITLAGNIATFTTSSGFHNLRKARITISGQAQSEYNGVWSGNAINETQFQWTMPGTPSAPTGTCTMTQFWDSNAIDTTENFYQTNEGPRLAVRPTMDVNPQDGVTVTCLTTPQPGITYSYRRYINGLPIADNINDPSFSIPALTSNTIDLYRLTSDQSAQMSVEVTATRTSDGAKSIVMAIWPSKRIFETIIP